MGMKQKAFTLIELLVVVAIIGILAAVGVVAYNGYTSAAKRNATNIIYKTVIADVKAKWAGCDAGIPIYLYSSSSKKIDTNSDWCTFSSSTNSTAQAFVHHYIETFKNPYRPNVEAVGTSCPSDDALKPGCMEIIGTDKDNSNCGHCDPPIKAGEFVFQIYNLDSNGKLTKLREHFQTR